MGKHGRKKKKRLGKWHEWFAWYPVIINQNKYHWLEIVERRGIYHISHGDEGWLWKYREKQSATTN